MTVPKRIAVLVSGSGTNLQALIDSEKSGALRSGSIVLVVSNREGAYALRRAENAGIESMTVPSKNVGQEEFCEKLSAVLDEKEIDLIVLAGFLVILSERFTEKYAGRIINVHPSLIPSFCGEGFYGLKVHEAALERGVKVTGATVHFVTKVTDGGPIILQKAVEVKDGDTPEILQRRVMEEAEWKLLPAAAEKVCAEMMKNSITKGTEK